MGNINLNLGCSLEAMREMEDNQYDLAIVDPPYGISININMGRRSGDLPSQYKHFHGEDKESPPVEYFEHLIRVSRNQIIWGANHFISKMPWDSKSWIVWDKKFSNDVSFASCELAWTSLDKTVKKYTQSTANKDRIHPTQKPVALYRWLLDNYAQEGNKILDTHLGSGSIALACYDAGFSLDAWEIDPDYHSKAVARFEKHSRQLRLFGGDDG